MHLVGGVHICAYISSYAANIDYNAHGKLCVCLKHYILLSVGFMLMIMQSYFFHVQLFFFFLRGLHSHLPENQF